MGVLCYTAKYYMDVQPTGEYSAVIEKWYIRVLTQMTRVYCVVIAM